MTAAPRRTSSPTILDRLRHETRDEHEAAEHGLDWERRVASPAAYRELLERLHAFHRWWEPMIAARIGDPEFTTPRGKVAMIEQDLHRLGTSDQAIAAPPRPEPALRLDTVARALGSMYVLEGSTLGGQIIARRVRETLGFDPAYHGSYGRRIGAMWREFQARLVSTIGAAEADDAIDVARRTFRLLRERLA